MPTNISVDMIILISKINTKYKILKPNTSSVMKDTKMSYYLCVFIKSDIILLQVQCFIHI